ncbi:hypothetical protein GQ53DRAFT_611250, partial [Thozetella sp. PMI_491]
LDPVQLQALLDVLTHYQSYAEFQHLRNPDAVKCFGPPFTGSTGGGPTPYPVLQLLAEKFMQRELLSDSMWSNMAAALQRLSAANLSDSYDKGIMGLRKSGATAMSAMVESLARGVLAGKARADHPRQAGGRYNHSKADDLERAWDDAVDGMMHGNLLDEVFDSVIKSGNIDDLPPVARAALELVIVQAATIMHHFFVVMIDGQTFLQMIDLVDTLTPYTIIKQTVRIGNVSAMMNAMTKVLLAKVNGKNLLQTITSKAIGWDISVFEKRARKIEKAKSGPGKILGAIEDYTKQPFATQERVRLRSQEQGISIVSAILEAYHVDYASISIEHHDMTQEYYQCLLAIRDRRQGIDAMVTQEPDLMSDMVREGMKLFEPILQVLSKGKFDMGQAIKLQKSFTGDLIKTAKIKKGYTPSIENFVGLLKRQLPFTWGMLHDGAKKCPSLAEDIKKLCQNALSQFPSEGLSNSNDVPRELALALLDAFDQLPPREQGTARSALDAHAAYLSRLRETSLKQLQQILKEDSKTSLGSGLIIPRWESLLDATRITPATIRGPVRRGREV